MVDMAHVAGLVAGRRASQPRAARATSSPSTTHKTLAGRAAGSILCEPSSAKKIDSAVFPGCRAAR